MTCSHCGNQTYLDLSSIRRCRSCDRTPAWCRCQRPAVADVVPFRPAWLRNLDAKDFSGQVRAA